MRRTTGLVLLAVLLASCAKDKAAGPPVDVVASNTACGVAKLDLPAGRTTFRVSNEGTDVTEVYVYAAGDKVVSEKENIGPGTTATFTAHLVAGDYQLACKPGQKGDGIRTAIHVSGAAAAPSLKAPDYEVGFRARDDVFLGLESFRTKHGDTVKFEMRNQGKSEHEFEVFAPDGSALGEIGPTKPGTEGDVALTFATPGDYRYVCGIADHEKRGMKGTFHVG